MQMQLHSVRVSAVTNSTAISLSGRPSELAAFRDFIGPNATVLKLHVDAWYHGGEKFDQIVGQIIRDTEIRQIKFPAFTDLKTTLRSTYDVVTRTKTLEADSLAQWILRQLFVWPADWLNISHGVILSMKEALKSHPTLRFKVLSFGPSSNSLFSEFTSDPLSANFETIDQSPFNVNTSHPSHTIATDIAIVGMGVNFPGGKDQEALWETLSKGLSIVSKVSPTLASMSYIWRSNRPALGTHWHTI